MHCSDDEKENLEAEAGILRRFSSEPYRVFFPLGIAMGLVGVGHWLFAALGLLSGYSAFFHSSIQMQAYMASFVFGFLMTMIPRLRSAPTSTKREVGFFVLLALGVLAFNSTGHFALAQLCFAIWVLGFVRFAVSRFWMTRGKVKTGPPVEFVWIPVAMVHALTG